MIDPMLFPGDVRGHDALPNDLSQIIQDPLQLLQSLWEGVNYGLFILDVLEDGQEFRFLTCNPTITRTSSVPVDYLVGKTVTESFPEDIAQLYQQRYQECVNSQQAVTFEEHFYHEGQETWWLVTVNPLRDPAQPDSIHQLLVTTIDIGDRVKLERDRQKIEVSLEQIESRFRQLVENADDVVGVWGLDGTFHYLSPGFQTTFGYDPNDWIGKAFDPLVHPDDLSMCVTENHQVAVTGERRSGVEFRHRHRDGHWIWMSINISPIKDTSDQVVAFQGILRNISDRKAAEIALQNYASRQTLLNQLISQLRNTLDFDTIVVTTLQSLQQLLNLDHCGFVWYDPTTEPPSWNMIQEAKQPDIPSRIGSYPATLMGPIEHQLLNQQILKIDDVILYDEPIHQAFLQATGCQSEILLPIQNDTQGIGALICLQYSQIRSWTDTDVALLTTVRDQLAIAINQANLYAESCAKQQELQQTLQELKRTQAQMVQSEKMSSLGQLVAGVAHEINNPVNFIHGNLLYAKDSIQALLELAELYQQTYSQPTPAIADKLADIDLDFLSNDLPKLLASMQVGTERIREIVKSLRLFSRLDEAEVKSVNIHEGIDSTLMILQNRLKAKPDRAVIQVIKNYGDLPLVECLAGQLNQVFMNLLANAIDALEERDYGRSISEQAQHPSTIEITTKLSAHHQIIIRIQDNGPGIPEAIQPQIFDPFFTTKPVGQGTGMGLAISYQIITEKHGGQLICRSHPKAGTAFVIHLPIHQSF